MTKTKRLIAALLLSQNAFAVTIEGVDYAPKVQHGGKDLILNGAGVRRASRFGLTFKVYTGALYVTKKSSNGQEILENPEPKYIRMDFLRRVDKSDLSEGFETSYSDNCLVDCEKSKAILKQMTNAMPDVLNKGSMEFWFYPDRAEYLIKGRTEVKGRLDGASVSKNLLAEWIGRKPVDPKFQNQLLDKAE